MAQKLLRLFSAKIIPLLFFSLFIASGSGTVSGQTVLSPGDLAFVTVDTDAENPGGFEFVALVDLEKGTVINFTTSQWDNTGNSFRDENRVLTYSAPRDLSAGSVISFTGKEENGFVRDKNFDISESADNILVYQETEGRLRFIYGIGWSAESAVWNDSGDSSGGAGSDIPPGLSEAGRTVLTLDAANHRQYDSTRGTEGTKTELLEQLSDASNWPLEIRSGPDFSSGFTLSDPDSLAESDRPPPSGITMEIGGSEGWRMITVPERNITFSELLGNFRVQGIPGSSDPSGDPTLYFWEESSNDTSLALPGAMSELMEPGRGYMIYFFEDDNNSLPGIQGGFPKRLSLPNSENSSAVNITLSATDRNDNGRIDGNEGWNLVGNPFKAEISVSELFAALGAVEIRLNRNIYVWDSEKGNGNGGFRVLSDGEVIAPFQAFFVRYGGDKEFKETITLNRNSLAVNEETELYRETPENDFGFTLQMSDGSVFDEYSLLFSDGSAGDPEAGDLFKPYFPPGGAINLYGRSGAEKLREKVLPKELETSVEIPIHFDSRSEGELIFSWEGTEDLPGEWSVTLIDRLRNREIDLKTSARYRFFYEGDPRADNMKMPSRSSAPRRDTGTGAEDARFILSVTPGSAGRVENALPVSVNLKPNYPNPFSLTTNITFELTEQTDVVLTVWNMIGQKVATLVDGAREAGEHTEPWNAGNMPSGMYIAQLEVGGRVYIRKMTLIK